MYCRQDLQLRWPVKVGLMYCLQDLQLRWPVKLGLMYCLQDLQLRWPVKAVWQERSALRRFIISAVTNLQVLLIAVRQYHITPAEQLQIALMLHYCTFPFRLPVNCNWWTNLSCDCNERFCCCIAKAAQIALSPNCGLARFALKQGIQRPCQPTLQQDSLPPASIPQPLSYYWRNFCPQSANTQWGRSGLQRCDSDREANCCSFVTAKDWRGFSCAWNIWQLCVNQQ